MSTIATPTLTAAESSPASAGAAWDLSRLLITQLADGWEVTTTWPGQVAGGNTSAEKRVVSSGRPVRTIRHTLRSDSAAASWLIQNGLLRMGQCRSLVPLCPDYTTLAAPASANVLTCDTTLRRLSVGGLVAVAVPTTGKLPFARFETATIGAITPTSITLAANLSAAYPARSRVLPLALCDVELVATAQVRHGRPSLSVEATEVAGPTALPPLCDPGDVTTVWPTAGGYPVFYPGPSAPGRAYGWASTSDGWRRDGHAARVGLGTAYELFGPRPRGTSARTAQGITRADAWPLLQFFDLVRGRCLPFYAPATSYLAPPTAIAASTVTLPAAGPLEDWSAYPYLAVIGREPSPTAARVRGVQSVTRAAGVDTLTLATPLDATAVTSAIGVAPARLVRFDTADLTERWRTSVNLSLTFSLIELLAEQPVVISNL